MNEAYRRLMERVREIGCLQSIGALLDWDQETQMPREGVTVRARQSALMAGLAHERLTDPQLRRLLDEADAGSDPVAETNLRETRRVVERAVKLPNELVRRIAETSSKAKEVWADARARSDFNAFAPMLGTLIDLKREVADRIGYETEPYDALMDEYEPGMRAAVVETIFNQLRDGIAALLPPLMEATRKPDPSILRRRFPEDRQRAVCRRLAESIGFDFRAGRLDVSTHPFCTTIGGAGDVRITTRYNESFLPSALFGVLHEAGHALYEQGLPREHVFTPAGEAVSLGIHESQSRLWENFVGRSRWFWEHHYESLQQTFPESLGDVSLDAFHAAVNTVTPSLIRVEADELTYNLHIVLRFEIERSLIRGTLRVEDVPAAWNEGMEKTLGVRPQRDAEGCFPTYALGNLYAAQFFAQARKEIPDLPQRIAENDHAPLREWLREKIHRHGQRHRAAELVERVTGKPLSTEPFLRYVREKFSDIYGL